MVLKSNSFAGFGLNLDQATIALSSFTPSSYSMLVATEIAIVDSGSCSVGIACAAVDSDSLIAEVDLSLLLLELSGCVVLLSTVALDSSPFGCIESVVDLTFKRILHRHFDLKNSYFCNFHQVFCYRSFSICSNLLDFSSTIYSICCSF